MTNETLDTVLTRKLPSCHADLDEVCVSFYPTLNPELFKPVAHEAQFYKTPANKIDDHVLDEHELALVG